jgi:DNA-binding beta-propeller fold protein YncE
MGRTLTLLSVLLLAGCGSSSGKPELVWGQRGVRDGDLMRPRAIAIDNADRLFLVDFTARIQVYDLEGKYTGPTWTTPDYRNGRPSGLGIDRYGNLIVCDSHYHCLRLYSAGGDLLRTLAGEEAGFSYISDAVQDADGFFYVSEFGDQDRITKLTEDGQIVMHWGKLGSEPGELNRPRALALGPDGNLYVADACNHRIQVFTRNGDSIRCFGTPGSGAGELRYPYDLSFAKSGILYVVERFNGRVQKFTKEGKSLGTWGSPGRQPGQFNEPWALAVDRHGKVHVVDTENHRVQQIDF